jgi:hypothetical protein
MKRILGFAMVAVSLTACATGPRPHADVSGQALPGRWAEAECWAMAERLTSPSNPSFGAPVPGTFVWTDARQWANATASSKAQIERDLRQFMYRDCLRASG